MLFRSVSQSRYEAIGFYAEEIPVSQPARRVDFNNENIFPFSAGYPAYVESIERAYDDNPDLEVYTQYALKSFLKYRYIDEYQVGNTFNNPVSPHNEKYVAAAGELQAGIYVNDVVNYDRMSQQQYDNTITWENKARKV